MIFKITYFYKRKVQEVRHKNVAGGNKGVSLGPRPHTGKKLREATRVKSREFELGTVLTRRGCFTFQAFVHPSSYFDEQIETDQSYISPSL